MLRFVPCLILCSLAAGCSRLESYRVPLRTVSEPAPEDYAFYSSLYRASGSLQRGEVIAVAAQVLTSPTPDYFRCFAATSAEERGFERAALALDGKALLWKARFDFGRPYRVLAAREVLEAENCISEPGPQTDPKCAAYSGIRYVRHLSLPVFNRDRSRVLVAFARVCGGLCGDGSVQVYRLRKGVFEPETNSFVHCRWVF